MSHDLKRFGSKRLNRLRIIKLLSRHASFEDLCSLSFKMVMAKQRAFNLCLSQTVDIDKAFIRWNLTVDHLFCMNFHIISQLHLGELIVRTGHVEISRLPDYDLAHFIDEDALRFRKEPQRCQCLSSYTLNELLQVKLLVDLNSCFFNEPLML